MILPSMWQILKKYPYLIPALVVVLVLFAIGWVIESARKLGRRGNCPGCGKKSVCVVACERVSRRLSEMEEGVFQ
ncbi:MAG: hypothetical protein AB9919_06755 [Geobacteraceae bacterium]